MAFTKFSFAAVYTDLVKISVRKDHISKPKKHPKLTMKNYQKILT